MTDAIIHIAKITIKLVFFSIPAIVVAMLIAFMSGNLTYTDLKDSAKEIYATSYNIVETVNPYNWKENLIEIGKGIVDGWESPLFGSILPEGDTFEEMANNSLQRGENMIKAYYYEHGMKEEFDKRYGEGAYDEYANSVEDS